MISIPPMWHTCHVIITISVSTHVVYMPCNYNDIFSTHVVYMPCDKDIPVCSTHVVYMPCDNDIFSTHVVYMPCDKDICSTHVVYMPCDKDICSTCLLLPNIAIKPQESIMPSSWVYVWPFVKTGVDARKLVKHDVFIMAWWECAMMHVKETHWWTYTLHGTIIRSVIMFFSYT